MTSPGGNPGGINLTTLWVNVAPSMSGMASQMQSGGASAANSFMSGFQGVFTGGMAGIMSGIHGMFDKVWKETQNGLKTAVEGVSYAMEHMLEGEAPRVDDFTAALKGVEGQ